MLFLSTYTLIGHCSCFYGFWTTWGPSFEALGTHSSRIKVSKEWLDQEIMIDKKRRQSENYWSISTRLKCGSKILTHLESLKTKEDKQESDIEWNGVSTQVHMDQEFHHNTRGETKLSFNRSSHKLRISTQQKVSRDQVSTWFHRGRNSPTGRARIRAILMLAKTTLASYDDQLPGLPTWNVLIVTRSLLPYGSHQKL